MARQAASFFTRALDVGRLIADRDGVTLRAQGTCMYPVVRHGDVLRIAARRARELAVGDIAVCSRGGVLVAHRVIATGARDGRAFVVTRADRGRGEGDAPAFDDDLLGVVVSITRRGRPVPLSPAADRRLARLGHAVGAWWVDARPRVLGRVQEQRPYGVLARWWLALARPRLSYQVRLPLNGQLGDVLFRQLDPGEFDPASAALGGAAERWILALHVNASKEPAARATVAREPGGDWQIRDCEVRARYRGTGLDDAVRRKVGEILARGA